MPRKNLPHQISDGDELGRDQGPDEPRVQAQPYSVGKGRPPVASRFKPGQSGNPKGRRRKSRNMRTVVRLVLDEQMSVREGTRVRRMSAFEALVRTLLRRAYKGDPKSVAALIILMRQFGLASDLHDPSEDLLLASDYQTIIAEFLGRNRSSDIASKEEANSVGTPSLSKRSEP